MRSFLYKGRFIFIPLAAAAFLSFISFVVMNLWNILLPEILHVGTITFWQAMGIFILCKILFGFGKGRGPGRFGGGGYWMKRGMEERLAAMTPEQKEKFKEKMRNCGRGKWERHGGHPFEKYWDDIKPAEEKTAE